MFRYTVLVVRLEQTPDHVRIVSICPYSYPRDILGEEILGPEDLLLSRASTLLRAAVCGGNIRWSKPRFDMVAPTRRAGRGLVIDRPAARPCFQRMSPQAVYEDDAAVG